MATRKVVKVRLENRRDPVVYFRDIVLEGKKLRVEAGNTDTSSGKTSWFEKFGERFATEQEASARFERLVEQASRNFKSSTRTEEEVQARDEGLARFVENPALEAQVLSAPDSAEQARVFADWLQTQGDARGELAALFQSGRQAQAQEHLLQNADRFFGDLDVKLDNELYDLDWAHGFLRGASLRRRNIDSNTDLGALTKSFLALPIARLVTKLRFGLAGYESDNDWSSTMEAIASSAQASQLKALLFNDYMSEDCEISWTAFGDFSSYWRSLPALEVFHLRSGEGGVLGDIELPSLKKFVRESGGLSREEIDSIVRAKWPRLEWLELWFGSENYGAGGSVEAVQPLLDGKVPATLTHLGLVNAEFTQDLVEPLARSKLLGQLKVLDLSKGTLLDEDVEALLRHAGAFKHLDKLILDENLLDSRTAELSAALPNVSVEKQRFDEGYTDAENRYAAVGE